MEENITIRVLNSNSDIPKDKRSYLTYSNRHLVPCTLTEDEDSFSLNFSTDGLDSLKDVKLDELECLLFLSNCAELIELGSRYSFTIAPENIFVDRNRIPLVLNRDFGTVESEEFVREYKSLIASFLNDKYTYEDYLKGGQDLFAKDKFLAQIKDMNDADEISGKLMELYSEKKKYNEEHYELVKKGANKYTKILLPIVSVLLVASIVLGVYAMVFKIPLQKKIIDANAAYLNNDYIGVENILLDVPVDKLPYATKYILAVSYIKSASLSQEEKQNELNLITTKTDEVIFDYWIHMGRLEFTEAIDDAQRLNSDSHLYYAYLCYRDYAENDRSLSGDEKISLISTLNEKIESLAEQLREIQNPEATEPSEDVTEESEETEETVTEETAEMIDETQVSEETLVPEGSTDELQLEETEVPGEELTDEDVNSN